MKTRNGPASSPDDEGEAKDRLNILLAAPRGFCAGVRRAIEAVEQALEHFGAPVYVRRAIVHNDEVVRSLEAKGAVFVRELNEVPDDSVLIFSAHGVARKVTEEARRRGLFHLDAVCPLVSKIHREVAAFHRDGRHVLVIGHEDHPEIIGTLGQIPPGSAKVVATAEAVRDLDLEPDRPLAFAVQSTYSVDEAEIVIAALRRRFVDLKAPASSDICYATTNRQSAVKQMAGQVESIIVVGEVYSSNARRLAEVAKAAGCPSVQLVASAPELDWKRIDGCRTIGISAAASTPETSVTGLIEALESRFRVKVREFGTIQEKTSFKPLKIGLPSPARASAG